MKEFWSLGKSSWGRWELRYSPEGDPNRYTIKEYFGTGLLDAAVEFDGNFFLKPEQSHLSLETAPPAKLFIVTANGKLYYKEALADIQSSFLLASDVKKVSAVRGWCSDEYSVDSGVWVAYLKNNHDICYRIWYSTPEMTYWTAEEILTNDLTATGVKVMRLNDYRVGIFVIPSGKLYLGKQTFIGDTVKSEYIIVDSDIPLFTIPFRDITTDNLDPLELVNQTRINAYILDAEFNFPVFNYDVSYPSITMVGSPPPGQGIAALEFIDKHLKIYLKKPITTALTEFKFEVTSRNRLGYRVSGQGRPIWPAMTIVFPSDPYAFTEHISIDSKATLHFAMKPIQDVYHELQENVLITAAAELTFNVNPVKEQEVTVTENVNVVAAVPTIVFNTQMTGDTPI